MNLFLPYRPPRDGAGRARRILARLGPSWLASPVRRTLQVLSLALLLALFFYVMWPYGSQNYAALRESKEAVEAEAFLALDPLVSISTAVAARAAVWSLAWAGVLLAVCLIFPRGFCGYLCPLGTLIDLTDWLVGRRVKFLRPQREGGWRHVRHYLLAAVLVAAAMGVLVSGFLAAMPVLVRGMAFALSPLQIGLTKGWYLVPPIGAGQILSIALFAAVFAMALLGPRFWCRCVCPTGAIFSLANLLRLTERKVADSCICCGKCAEACPFGAIKPDFSTRPLDCTFCQTCGGVCPVGAIRFTLRREPAAGAAGDSPVAESPAAPAAGSRGQAGRGAVAPDVALSRRALLGGAVGGVAAAMGARGVGMAHAPPPVRPPGSVPEPEFLRMCIRCGACYQACPNNVLQPMGWQPSADALWTPQVAANWSGCEPSCNNCGHVCPTGAVRPLPIEEKRAARMGLAVLNKETCLPYVGFEGNCRMCVDECRAAGYDAIEFVRVNVEMDTDGKPIEDTGTLVPVVIAEKCVGCGLCQTRCHRINVATNHYLDETAIRVLAGPGKEDRLMSGSYLALRKAEQQARDEERRKREGPGGGDAYLPDFLK